MTTAPTQSGLPRPDAPAPLDQSDDLLPGEKQTFDYHHQSCPPVVRDREVEVFDYNHRPARPRWNVPPPPPHPMGPLGPPPFPPEPHWGLPPPPPPDLPPPIPYFDLPAGIMAPLVPVSSLYMYFILRHRIAGNFLPWGGVHKSAQKRLCLIFTNRALCVCTCACMIHVHV